MSSEATYNLKTLSLLKHFKYWHLLKNIMYMGRMS